MLQIGRGQIHVVLRHVEDRTRIERVPHKSFADVFAVQRRTAPAARRSIEQLRGEEP